MARFVDDPLEGDASPAGRLIDAKRLEAFSDAVMAVIITLMALEIHAPSAPSKDALNHELPLLLIYILSFTFIGIYWNNHHHMMRATRHIDAAVMWANLHLLFWLSLVPVATEWTGRFYDYKLPATVYGVVGAGAAFAYYLLIRAIVRANKGDYPVTVAAASHKKGVVSLAMYLIAIGFSALSGWIAYAIFAAVAVLWLVPDSFVSA